MPPSVAKNTFSLTLGFIGQKVLSLIYFSLLARSLGPEEVGKYTFALAFTTIFSILADIGITPVFIREVARDERASRRILAVLLPIKLLLTLLASSAAIGSALILHYPPHVVLLILLSSGVMALDALHLSFYGFLRGKKILSYESIGVIAGQALTVTLGILGIFWHLPLPFFMVALGVGSIFNVLWSGITAWRLGMRFFFLWEPKLVRTLLAAAIPFALAGIFTKVYSYIDTVLLASLKDNFTVGIYSVPYKITYAFQFLPMALSAALFPALSSAYKKDTREFRLLFERGLSYMAILVLPIVAGIFTLAPEILVHIFGSAFEPSLEPLRVSIFGLLFIFLYFPAGAALNAAERQGTNTFFMGIAMIVNIFLNIFLIPSLGATGASIAAVATNAILFCLVFITVVKMVGWPKGITPLIVKTTLAAVIMSAAVFGAKDFLPSPLLSIPCGALIFILLTFFFGIVKKNDIELARRVFRREKPAEAPPANQS
ncbi:MAG: flippase [Patescibacteria group bacterium]